jgi:hypothetical protein
MADQTWIGLVDAVMALRAELSAAVEAGRGESLRFELGPIQMELAVTVRREAGGSAGIQFGVVSVGGKGGVSNETIHRLTLALTAKEADSGRAPEIASVDPKGDRQIPGR